MGTFQKIKKTLRSNVWWNSKIPPLFALGYMLILLKGATFVEASLALAYFMVWLIGAAGFGNYLNDLADVEEDAQAGKENGAADHSSLKRGLILGGMAALALLPWSIQLNVSCLIFTGIHLLLFVLYSVRPIRLKERGLLGILADASYAHIVPVMVAVFAFGPQVHFERPELTLVALIIWGLAFGIRGIFIHQIADLDNDIVTGTKTFVVKTGPDKLVPVLKYALIPLEFISFMAVFLLNGSSYAWIALVFLAYILYKFLLWKVVWKFDFSQNYGLNAYNSFFSNFYEQWLGPLLLIPLVLKEPLFLIVLGLHLFLFQETVTKLWEEMRSIRHYLRNG